MASQKAEILFFKENVRFILRNKSEISNWLIAIAKKHKRKIGSLNYIFVNDKMLLEMNRKFLQHDTFTDIITFDYSEEPKKNNPIEGEIFISIDRVNENAVKFETFEKNELHRVMAHGLLHLCGFKDKSAKDKKQMRSQEEIALALRQF
jgi:probable rRNA maturation factor